MRLTNVTLNVHSNKVPLDQANYLALYTLTGTFVGTIPSNKEAIECFNQLHRNEHTTYNAYPRKSRRRISKYHE